MSGRHNGIPGDGIRRPEPARLGPGWEWSPTRRGKIPSASNMRGGFRTLALVGGAVLAAGLSGCAAVDWSAHGSSGGLSWFATTGGAMSGGGAGSGLFVRLGGLAIAAR
jgi:hypothetical protein